LEVISVGKREPLTPKQKLLIIITVVCLNVPAFIFIFCYSSEFTARQGAAAGAVNLLVVVPLLALISEKWIRRMK